MRGSSVTRHAIVLAAVLISLFGLVGSATAVIPDPAMSAPSALPADPPNIVMFYVDDVPPHDGSLWNDPSRTPNFVDHFINHGLQFDHALGEVPLCCPGRGSTLTGLHAHNSGLIHNNALEFDPSEHIGKALKDAGYASFYIGKYLNDANLLTPTQWDQHGAGWTQLDAIKLNNGDYFNFPLQTKQGTIKVKGLHSTKMVGDRMVMHMQETPADQPIFAVLSIFNMHGPNKPQAQDIGDPRCANMPPWNPPNYNEADVSDKPEPLQELPLLPNATGWPMVTHCEEMLGIDRVIGQVTNELAVEGRLNNTLLVFTADNGMAWGQHRLGQTKSWPYTTPVPLYMSWPAAHWGASEHLDSAIVSNIDLAPTFCDLAPTCVLGPFAHGKAGPDGVSLVPLITGAVPNLGRPAVYEASYIHDGWSYSALRTTAAYDLNERWHYVEYTNGFRELYDLVADPWEMQNLATDPGHASVVAALHTRLAQLRVEGVGPGTGSIRIVEDARPPSSADYTFTGDLGTFKLDDDTDPTLPSERTFSNLPTGYYTITRGQQLPWILSDVQCLGVQFFDQPAGKLVMLVHPGEQVTCTWIDSKPRPDALVAKAAPSSFKGNNIYFGAPSSKQTVRRDDAPTGSVTDYRLRLQNDGPVDDSFNVSATTSGPSTISVQFVFNQRDVTAEVMAGTFHVDLVTPASLRNLSVRVTVGPGTPLDSVFIVLVTARSQADPTVLDVVRMITTT